MVRVSLFSSQWLRCLALGGLFLAYSLGGFSVAEESPILSSEFVYEKAPFPSCHASTIVETLDGTLVTAWFGGQHEKAPDVGIWVSRKVDQVWTSPIEVANGVQYQKIDGTTVRHPTWNPVLFQPQNGPLLLFYKVGPDPQRWWGLVTESADQGKTWSTPRPLPQGILGPIKNKPIELANGDILCPSSTESPTTRLWQVHMEITSDHGRTWKRSKALNDGIAMGAIQPSLLKRTETELLAVGRSQQGSVFQMKSSDSGRTWGEMQASMLPNPNSGIDAVTLRDSRHLLVYNHVLTEPGVWKDRSPLNIAISSDGLAWQAALELENAPKEEFSYPAIIQTRDGLVHMTYTWNRKKIKHVVVDPNKIVPKAYQDRKWPK